MRVKTSPRFEIALVLVRFDHVVSVIVKANHCVMRPTAKLGVADCISDCVWLTVPEPTQWERIGDEIKAVMIFPYRATANSNSACSRP
ncbi:MAG: hypothetical protein E6L08_05095 [Verrucomicrobia bacterium]|nr:MAG: hypothetical protein E6L08_05095 [Verrucomicrobiota bacterium]